MVLGCLYSFVNWKAIIFNRFLSAGMLGQPVVTCHVGQDSSCRAYMWHKTYWFELSRYSVHSAAQLTAVAGAMLKNIIQLYELQIQFISHCLHFEDGCHVLFWAWHWCMCEWVVAIRILSRHCWSCSSWPQTMHQWFQFSQKDSDFFPGIIPLIINRNWA